MPLEAVMVCLDNSDYTRNGDYAPTRFRAQNEAANLVCGAKCSQHPENSVGVLCTAGDRVEVMVTPTSDLGKMTNELGKVNIGGMSDFVRGIQIAALALKHRQNKGQRQRIIAFVGSPILATEKELETLGKSLKKNNISVDLISFGEVEENNAKLQKFHSAVNVHDQSSQTDSSHLLEIPVGPKLLSDVVLSSAIISPEGEGMGGGGGGGDGAGFEFGVDPSADPELALALRVSLEEERARHEAANREANGGAADGAAAGTTDATAGTAPVVPESASATAPAATAVNAPTSAATAMPVAPDAAVLEALNMEDCDEELKQALLLSLQEAGPMEVDGGAPSATTEAAPPSTTEPPKPESTPAPADKDIKMADAPAAAVESAAASEAKAPAPEGASAPMEDATGGEDKLDSKWFQDPAFVQELLGSLPGVDINDPRIQKALKDVGGEGGEEGSGGTDNAGGSANGSSGSEEKKP